jgi:group I intron endonuclease
MRNQKMEVKWNSKISGIYAWENKVNGKMYIGKANNLYRRIYEEMSGFRNGKHQNLKKLFNAVQKYGIDNFQVIKLLEVPKQYLGRIEILLIEYYNTKKNGYNCTTGGEGTFGHKVSVNQIKIQKERMKKYWTDERKKEHKEKMKIWFNSKTSDEKQEMKNGGSLWLKNPNIVKKHKENCQKSLITTNRIEKQRNSLKNYYKKHKSKKAISISVIDPNGVKLSIIGVDKFCKDYGFGYRSIKKLINGQKSDHKGWKMTKKEI